MQLRVCECELLVDSTELSSTRIVTYLANSQFRYLGRSKNMAASFASALLDELMGRNRNKHPEGQRKTHWSDPEVMYFTALFYICRYYCRCGSGMHDAQQL